MPQIASRAVIRAVLSLAVGVLTPVGLFAQPAAERRPVQAPQGQVVSPRDQVSRERDTDAQEIRRDFLDILRRHPPAVARILKLDPSLMRNENYMSAYPSIAEFIARHPEISQNASFYLEQVYGVDGRWQPESPQLDLIRGTLAGLAGLTAFTIVVSTLIWLIKTTIEQRRWSRLSKIQAEVHSKLMDRFSSNDELLTYVQTPSGRRFLESGPSPLQETPSPRAVAAPFARILWSVQIGIVMLALAAGLMVVSSNTVEEAKQFFFIFGSVAMALGAGFTVSAAASYFLSRKLGLVEAPTTDHA
jgi:hypothetical protein